MMFSLVDEGMIVANEILTNERKMCNLEYYLKILFA